MAKWSSPNWRCDLPYLCVSLSKILNPYLHYHPAQGQRLDLEYPSSSILAEPQCQTPGPGSDLGHSIILCGPQRRIMSVTGFRFQKCVIHQLVIQVLTSGDHTFIWVHRLSEGNHSYNVARDKKIVWHPCCSNTMTLCPSKSPFWFWTGVPYPYVRLTEDSSSCLSICALRLTVQSIVQTVLVPPEENKWTNKAESKQSCSKWAADSQGQTTSPSADILCEKLSRMKHRK